MYYEEDNYEKQIESQLLELGVSELDEDEVKEFHQKSVKLEDGVKKPFVAVPPSTSSVRWYSNSFSYYYNGVYYHIQELYAQGLSINSSLVNGRDGATIYTAKKVSVNTLKFLASIYAQKVIGLIPVVQWTPYEILFSDTSKVTNNSHRVTYRGVSTVCFSYVRDSLSYVSNSVSVASTNTFAGINNGVPYTKSKDTTYTVRASNYANSSSAVTGYLGSFHSSYVSYYRFYNHDRSAYINQSVVNPRYPSQI